MPITKSSSFEPFMKEIITDLYTTGLMKRIKQKWLENDRQCEKSDVKPISPQKVITCFIWIICGMTASIFIFIAEKSILSCKKADDNIQSTKEDETRTKIRNFVDDLFQQENIPDDRLINMILSAANEKIIKQTSL